MIEAWLATGWGAAGMAVVSALGIYLAMVILTRIAGLRSFSKISSFDFAVTVAIGSVLATTIVSDDPPLARAAIALAALYGIQMAVAWLRTRSEAVRRGVDNAPLLLMDGKRILHGNLRKAKLTEADLRGKLREANVLTPEQIRAVVMESTGDVSVLHGDADGPDLDPSLLEGVRGASEPDRGDGLAVDHADDRRGHEDGAG
ncbi:MAG: DUF421 domain-containing protein [Gemmatimonadota bacterium]|nr:DUF421 domain-containing protein [Gemmatimonadota bacterium]